MDRIIKVPDMHCENCVRRITEALLNAKIEAVVNLSEQTVTVKGCENCFKTAFEEIYDLGFSPEEVE
jgi:copper chaperone CopZ